MVLNTVEANTLTENLLTQAQSQAQELQSRRRSCSSNADLAAQAPLAEELEVEPRTRGRAAKRL